jgi:hypothetical protein
LKDEATSEKLRLMILKIAWQYQKVIAKSAFGDDSTHQQCFP